MFIPLGYRQQKAAKAETMIFRRKMEAANYKFLNKIQKPLTYKHGKKGRDGVPFPAF